MRAQNVLHRAAKIRRRAAAVSPVPEVYDQLERCALEALCVACAATQLKQDQRSKEAAAGAERL